MSSESGGGRILSEDEVEALNARARVLMTPGADRDDFVNLLDSLAGIYAEEGEADKADVVSDFAQLMDAAE